MKKIIIALSVLLIISACQQHDKSNKIKFDIPVLLDRSEKLQYSIEWPETKNRYADIQHKLIKNPDNIDELIKLSNLFISEARITGEHGHYYNAAIQVVNHALNIKNISKDQKFLALRSKAGIQLSLHDFRNALQTAQEALLLNPYNAQIYGALVDAYVELGMYDKAVECSDKMVSLRPDLSSYSRISYLREIHGMPDEAIKALSMAVEAGSPGSEEKAWAALQLAQLCFRYNKLSEAESILKQLLEERDEYPFAKAALAEIYIQKNKFTEAEKELKEACAIIPEVSFYMTLAELFRKQNRTLELKQQLDVILAMLNDDTKQGHNMSLEYAKFYLEFFDEPDRALAFLQKDMEMRPENIDINKTLAKIYLAKKDKDNAELYAQKANRTHSKNPELLQIQTNLNKI